MLTPPSASIDSVTRCLQAYLLYKSSMAQDKEFRTDYVLSLDASLNKSGLLRLNGLTAQLMKFGKLAPMECCQPYL